MESGKSNKHRKEECGLRSKQSASTSEPNLITAGKRLKPAGFPPGFIVDDLRWYRKKKPPAGISEGKDHLKFEDGSMKKFKSEYKRCYKKFHYLPTSGEDVQKSTEDLLAELTKPIRPTNYLNLEGDLELYPEYRDIFKGYPAQSPPLGRRQKEQLQLMDTRSEQSEKYIQFLSCPRTQLARRSSSLQREGEFMVKSSEMHSQFVKHDDAKRAEISRRPTSLRLEGDMAVTTETADKFIEFLIGGDHHQKRPELAKAKVDNLKLEGDMNTQTESNEKYVPFNLPQRASQTKQQTNLHLMEGSMNTQTEQQNKYVPFNVQERPPLVKRSTNLKLEGERDIKTEVQDKYVPFNMEERPHLIKKDTNLHLEGEMTTKTENKEKYTPYELSTRKKFVKRPTNLHLEGPMEGTTEQHDKYIPFDVKRPPLTKKDTNLHLEGDLVMSAEYRDSFVEFNPEKRQPIRPVNNLGLQNNTHERIKDNFFVEYQKPYRNPEPKFRYYYPPAEKHTRKPKENLKPEGNLDLSTESATNYTGHETTKTESKKSADNLQLEGQLEINPEYKNKFVEFPRERAKAVRPAEEITAQEIKQKRTRNYAQPAGNLKSEGRMESNPEYRSSYVDFPRERPVLRKPESSLKTEGHVSHLSEKESQFVEYDYAPRPPLAKRDTELKMEGRFECQPEYRKAYIAYIQRENITRKPRPFDDIISDEQTFDVNYSEGLPEPLRAAEKSKIPLSKDKQKSATRSLKVPSKAQTKSKSRSVSPDLRRKTPQTPHTPLQQRVLVPDMSSHTPRRPSSIFGPKTARWYPHNIDGIPTNRIQFSDEEDISVPCAPHRCCHSECMHTCHLSSSRWGSPCGRRGESSYSRRASPCEGRESSCRKASPCGRMDGTYSRKDYSAFSERCSPRLPSPSPPRRMWSKEHQPIKPDEKPASFVVLTDKLEINNNSVKDVGESRAYGGCCKEQKWMPPWYEPPM